MPLPPAATSLSVSTPDLSAGSGRLARAAPALCPEHRAPRVCQRSSCTALHVCRLYVDGFCPNSAAACRWGHAVSSEGNRAALAAHQLQALPERELLWMVRALLRQTAPVTAEEYRSQLAVCPQYAAGARCSRSDCFQLHLCPRLAAGRCGPEAACHWSHRLTDPDNVMVLLRLRCAGLSETEVLDRLARNLRHGGISSMRIPHRPGVYEEDPNSAERTKTSCGCRITLPPVCSSLMTGRRCSDAGCVAIHVCPHFLAGACRRQRCTLGHRLDTESNRRALRLVGRHVTVQNHDSLLDELYAVSENVQSSEIYENLRICVHHNHQSGCDKHSRCSRVHICQKFVAGTCEGGRHCSLGHVLCTRRNRKILRLLGLQNVEVDEVMEMLRAVHDLRSAYAK